MSNMTFENRYTVIPFGRMIQFARFYDKELDQWSIVDDPFQLVLLRKIYVDKYGVKLIGIGVGGNEIWDIDYEPQS